MRSRVLIGATVAILAGSTMSACSGGSSGATEGKSVTMWIYPVIYEEAAHKKFWADQVATFEKANPDINVTVQIYPWAKRDEALATAIASNTAPDVVYLIPDQLPGYADRLEPVDAYLSAESKADYLDNVRDSVTKNGKMLGAPILTSAQPLICDKRVFRAIGESKYPSTWDEFSTLGPKFKAEGIDLLSYWGSSDATLNASFYPLLWQAGGSVFSDDGKSVAFNSSQGVEALTYLKKLVDGGFVEKDTLTTPVPIEQSRLAKGKVACTWQNVPADVEKFWGEDNIAVLPPLKGVKSAGYGTIGSLSMLKSAKDKAAAGKWIDFATAPDVIKSYDKAANLFSPKKSTGALYGPGTVQGAMEATVPNMTVGALHPKARQVMGVLIPELQAALTGQKSPQQALDDAAKAATPLLNR